MKPIMTYQVYTPNIDRRGVVIDTKVHSVTKFAHIGDSCIGVPMLYIPKGQFWMGSPEDEEGRDDDEILHKVTVSSFFMSETPITEGQWRFVANNLPQEQIKLNPNTSSDGDEYPVRYVSWQDAIEFCARLSRYTGRNYRLPSESEWEYACRAGTSTPFYFGETITSDLVNCNAKYSPYAGAPRGLFRAKITPVKKFPCNAFGLSDMHGNDWEWCLDPWHDNYNGAPNDSRVWDDGKEGLYQDILGNLDTLLKDKRRRVVRGGSWLDSPRFCRSAYRINLSKTYCGFRVVCGGV